MAELDTPTPDYLKGFNDGYLIAKHEPDVATVLINVESKTERMEGMKAGMEEYVRENNKTNVPAWLKRDIKSLPEKEIGKDDKERD